jgi:hypothetical protein
MEFERLSRGLSLALPNAFDRLVDSTSTAYWYGRIFKVYLSDALRNPAGGGLQQRLRSFFNGCRFAVRAGGMLFEGDFRQAIRDDHVPNSHPRVLGR